MNKLSKINKSVVSLPMVVIVYSTIAVLVLIINILTGVIPPTLKYSISINVGCSLWSTVLYVIGNCFNSYCLFCFFRKKELPRLYRYFGYFVIVFIMLVSLFPIGLINDTINVIHNVFAGVIFLSLVVHTLIGTVSFRHNAGCLIPNIICLSVDIAVIAIFALFPKQFWSCTFIWEFILIVSYFMSLLFLLRKLKNDKPCL